MAKTGKDREFPGLSFTPITSMKRRKAFTLIELLITATIFVVVAGYSVVILSSTVGVTAQAQRSASAAAQARQAVDVLSKAFSQSIIGAATPAVVRPVNDLMVEGSMLIISVAILVPSGRASFADPQNTRVYCAFNSAPGKYRLAEFTVAELTNGQTYDENAANQPCTFQGVSNLFPSQVVSAPYFLTDDVTNVTRFSVIPVNAPSPNLDAVRISLTTVYDPALTDPTVTDRADTGSTNHPITVQGTAYRNFPYSRLPYSGLYP